MQHKEAIKLLDKIAGIAFNKEIDDQEKTLQSLKQLSPLQALSKEDIAQSELIEFKEILGSILNEEQVDWETAKAELADYLENRINTLKRDLRSTMSTIADNQKNYDDNFIENSIGLNKLYQEKKQIIENLQNLGVEMIDRKITVRMNQTLTGYEDIMEDEDYEPPTKNYIRRLISAIHGKNEFNIDFSEAVDYRVNENHISVKVSLYVNEADADILSGIIQSFMNKINNEEGWERPFVSASIEDYEPSLPGLKDTQDLEESLKQEDKTSKKHNLDLQL